MMYRNRVIFFLFLLFGSLSGQYFFGKNKIQPARYKWMVLQTEHFDIYYYPEEQTLAEHTAELAEEFFGELVFEFEFVPKERIPIVLYSSPNLFQETTTIPYILPENVAGFSDYIKGRVVIPFPGSFVEFKHTLKHELTHIFTFKYIEMVYEANEAFYYVYPPLWFMEGLAEHLSELKGPEMEFILRSSTLDGTTIPPERFDETYSGFKMYKLAEAFLLYLSEKYSPERILRLFENFLALRQMDYAFVATFGKSLEEEGNDWIFSLRRKYFPSLLTKREPKAYGKEILDKSWVFSPVYYCKDSVCSIIFKGSWMGYTGIYRFDGKSCELVLKGEFKEHFESFHGLTNRIDVNSKGYIVFTAKSCGRDILYIYDLNRSKIIRRKAFADIITINSPSFSSSGDSVVFSGVMYDGFTDLYLYIVSADTLIRLTSDIFDDRSPSISPDGRNIVFSSDREGSRKGLYFYSIDSFKVISSLTVEGVELDEPRWSSDGRIVFVGISDDGYDAFVFDGVRVYKVTDLTTAIFSPVLSPKGDSIIACCWWKDSYRLYSFPIEDTVLVEAMIKGYFERAERPTIAEKSVEAKTVGYKKRFTFDIAQGTVSTQSGTESGGGIELSLSDMLGEHQLYLLFYSYAENWRDILRETNLYITYTDRSRRFYWTIGGYHLFTRDYYSTSENYEEESFGVLGAFAYPFSRFRRIESLIFLRHNSRYDLFPQQKYSGFLGSLNLSYIKDNSQWDGIGPIDGMRSNLTCGVTFDFTGRRLYSSVLSADIRRYFRLGMRTTFATRMILRGSFGAKPERYFLGGSWSMRGYPFFYFEGSKIYMLNQELRFPLIERFALKTPLLSISFGGIKGATYFDLGGAFDKDFVKPLGSLGVGMRVNLAYYTVLRFDLAWKTDFKHIEPSPVWDIFFGWDF